MIQLIKILCGDELLADVEPLVDRYRLHNPARIVMIPGPEGVAVNLVSIVPGQMHTTIDLEKSAILYRVIELDSKLVAAYQERFSPIVHAASLPSNGQMFKGRN